MNNSSDGECIQHERECLEEHRPTQGNAKHAHIHGVSRVPVQPANNQPLRRVDGRRCTSSESSEVPDAPEVGRSSKKDENQRCQNIAERTDRLAASDEPRKIDGDRPGNSECEDEILKEQEHEAAAFAEVFRLTPKVGIQRRTVSCAFAGTKGRASFLRYASKCSWKCFERHRISRCLNRQVRIVKNRRININSFAVELGIDGFPRAGSRDIKGLRASPPDLRGLRWQ
jgi:hypothetical protein